MKRSHAIFAVVIAGLLIAVSYEAVLIWTTPQYAPQNSSALIDASKEIQAACNYLVSNYNATIGLVAETPAHQKYWLYSDNFLVAIVMRDDCGPSRTVYDIFLNTQGIVSQSYNPNQYQVLEDRTPYFKPSQNYPLGGPVWTTVNNQTGTLSPNDYADIGFLQAYYYAKWVGNTTQAGSLFNQALAKYNGTGFIDKAFQDQFQTYKLALYIYTARFLNRPVQLSALVALARMQDPNGGFHTGYLSDFSTNGTSTNTETTCLTILALHSLAA